MEIDVLSAKETETHREGEANEKGAREENMGLTVMEEETKQRLIVDSIETKDKKDSAESTTFGEKAVLLSCGYCDDQNNGTIRGATVTVGAGDTPLLPLVSTDPTSAPTSPKQGLECVAGESKCQTGGAQEFDKNMTERRDESVSEELKNCGANRRSDANQDGPSELPPKSLFLCSEIERMKGREERFSQEKKPEKKNKIEKSNVEDDTRSDGVNCAEASCHGHDHGNTDSRYSHSGGVGEEVDVRSGGDASSEEPGAGIAVDAQKNKLMKRKERFMAPPPAGNAPPSNSTKIPCAKVDAMSADSIAPKISTRTVPEDMSETESRRRIASEAAAKMARRAERFGATRVESRAPSVSETFCNDL